MRLYQKVILGILGLITISVVGVSGYAIKFFGDANKSVDNMVQTVNRTSSKREAQVSIQDREPFSILLMGIDTGDLGRTDQGRSDTMMVVTVNPKTKQSTVVSLDRDIRVQLKGDPSPEGFTSGGYDKLNHAYAYGGVEWAMDTVENLLDIPIDHYVSINMKGLSDLIDAVGGIEVDNQYHWELDGVEMYPGHVTLDGKTGLGYARFRKYDEVTGMGDPEGDIGRQRRQREVVEKIVRKIISIDSITNYQKILNAVEKNTKTDLQWNDMLDIAQNYLGAFDKIEQIQLEGEGQMINETYFQILGYNSLLNVQNTLKTQLGLPTATELSNGDDYTSGYADSQFVDDSQGTTDAGVQSYYDATADQGTYYETTPQYDQSGGVTYPEATTPPVEEYPQESIPPVVEVPEQGTEATTPSESIDGSI